MDSQKTCLIVAATSDAARDLALECTAPGDHVFFALPLAASAGEMAEEFRVRDPLAASASQECGALALVNLAIMAHGSIDQLLVGIEASAAGVLDSDPADVLHAHIQFPWELLRAAAPFLRRRKGSARFVVRGTGPLANCAADALASIAREAGAATGLAITCSRS